MAAWATKCLNRSKRVFESADIRLRYRLMKSIVLKLGLILVSLAFIELILRITGLSFPVWSIADDITGWTLKPNARGWNLRESFQYIEISDQGFRGPSVSVKKPENGLRIAVLGDSFIEGKQVAFENLLTSRLQYYLQVCRPNTSVEVLNFGVSGFGTAQELRLLETKVRQFTPDIVIGAFYLGNDVKNNSKLLSGNGEGSLQPYYTLSGEALELDETFKSSPGFAERRYGFVRNKLLTLYFFQIGKESFNILRTLLNGDDHTEAEREAFLFKETEDPAWRNAWVLSMELLERMHLEAERQHAQFLLGLISHPAQVTPNNMERSELLKRYNINDLWYRDREIISLGQEKGFDVISFGMEFEKQRSASNECFHGQFHNGAACDGHWNEHGHEVAAQILAQKLCLQPPSQ